MRIETQKVVEALLDKKPLRMARTHTDGENLYLHGNLIATVTRYPNGGIHEVKMTMAGWPTVTTRERLNGLIQSVAQRVTGTWTNAGFFQKKGKQYYNKPSGFQGASERPTAVEICPNETIILDAY